jgi:clan AA aspartic protease
MGLFSVDVELEGPAGRERVTMLVDTGATYSTVPQALATQLGLIPTESDVFEFADGREETLPIAEARLRVDGRSTTTKVIIVGSRPVLGAFALEGLRLGVDPVRKRLRPVKGFLGVSRKDELEAAAGRWHARAAKYDPAGQWYDKTVLHLPGICPAARGESGPEAERVADELLWRLVLVEVDEHLAADPTSENAIDGTAYGAVVLGAIPGMLEAIAQITPTILPLNAYSRLMTAIDCGLREPWTLDGVEALRRLVGGSIVPVDPAEDEPRQTVLLGRALAHLTPEDARLVRKTVCELLPLPQADMSTMLGISPAFAEAVATMRRALEDEPHH